MSQSPGPGPRIPDPDAPDPDTPDPDTPHRLEARSRAWISSQRPPPLAHSQFLPIHRNRSSGYTGSSAAAKRRAGRDWTTTADGLATDWLAGTPSIHPSSHPASRQAAGSSPRQQPPHQQGSGPQPNSTGAGGGKRQSGHHIPSHRPYHRSTRPRFDTHSSQPARAPSQPCQPACRQPACRQPARQSARQPCQGTDGAFRFRFNEMAAARTGGGEKKLIWAVPARPRLRASSADAMGWMRVRPRPRRAGSHRLAGWLAGWRAGWCGAGLWELG
jgi:hypothetical protein